LSSRKFIWTCPVFPFMFLSVACSFTVLSVHILQNKRGFNTDNVSAHSCLISLDAIGGVCVCIQCYSK
jgi:hypothetical protein